MQRLNTHFFFGQPGQGFVVIVAGLHNSEQGGIEVAHWIRTKLTELKSPTRLSAVVIPEVFPDKALDARATEWKTSPDKWNNRQSPVGDNYRKYQPGDIETNRQFPPPGQPLAVLDKGYLKALDGKTDILDKNRKRIPLLPEIRQLIQLIEAVQPERIVSIHGKFRRDEDDLRTANNLGTIKKMTEPEIQDWLASGMPAIKGLNYRGIFVDPRYSLCTSKFVKQEGPFYLEDCKFDLDEDPAFPNMGKTKRFDSAISLEGKSDDALARDIARAVKIIDLVAGNHLDPAEQPEVVHYAREGGTGKGFSLGDWGPVDVKPQKAGPGERNGAPVFTIEVDEDDESWTFLDGVQYRDENGKPTQDPYLKRNKPPYLPRKDARSYQLQSLAQAIIDVCLA
jgi:hypothetical protein